jgi:hypothetical protein
MIPFAARDEAHYHSSPTPVEIQQIEWEFSEVLKYYTALAPGRVLELGVHEGGTIYHWLRLGTEHTLVVGVDLRESSPLWGEWGPGTLEYIKGNTHSGDTIDKIAARAPYDFAHIDADHLEESARKDWDTVKKLVRPGGIVVFHDALIVNHNYGVNVCPVIREIQAEGYTTRELRCNPNQPWGTTVVVFIPD